MEHNTILSARKLSNSFCSKETLESSLLHLSKELNLLGFPFLYQVGSRWTDSDLINLVNVTYELLQFHKKNMKMHEELENRNLRTSSDLESLHCNNSRLKETINQQQRNMASVQERERQLNNQNKLLQQKLKSKCEEIKRITSVGQQKETQYLHDTRKKEREIEKLKERLQQLLSDRSKDRHCGMEVMNLLQRKDGSRGKWKNNNNSNKQEDEMYMLIIKDFEERHRIIVEENVTLRRLLADMNNELSLIVNCISDDGNQTEVKSDMTDSGHPEGPFNMPLDLIHDRIKKSMKEKFVLLTQRFHECQRDLLTPKASTARQVIEKDQVRCSIEQN